jgi:hypothetical protein
MIWGLNYKCFTNDSGLYFKTIIVTNLALATIINDKPTVVIYDDTVCYKLKRTF